MQAFYRPLKRLIEYGFKRKYHYEIPLFAKLKYAILGFESDEYVYNNLKINDYKEYLTYYEAFKARLLNGSFKPICDNKLIFEEVVGKYAKVPINYAYISNGYIYGLKDYDINNENVIQFIKQVKICALKLQKGSGGKGFYLIKYINNDDFEVSGKICSSQDVLKLLLEYEKEGLLVEYINQSAFSASLYPHSTNTMRIVCARKKNERDFHIVAASQRVGTKKSQPVDNIGSGGMVCSINIDSGKLSAGRILHADSIEQCIQKYEKHPDTNTQMKGLVIPDWEQIKKEILALTYKLPYLNFIAWDVLLTNNGFCIIEGNNSSGLNILQVEGGLRNSALGDIYRSYGINSVNDIRIKNK